MIAIPTIETDNLRLRGARMDDFDAYAEFRGSQRARHLGGPFSKEKSFLQLSEILGHWQLRGYGRWMVADKSTDAPLGIVGLYYPHGWPEPEIAWSVFANAEGKGIAYEAAMASRDYAYNRLGWNTAISLIIPENKRSLALAKRMGATFERNFNHAELGIMPIYRHPAKEPHDE